MRPTRKNTLGQTPKLSHAPCDKPLSSQASLRVLFPESILGVFLLFVVVVMYKRIGMSNESILHTTSAALLPLLFKPFAVSMAGRLHISHTQLTQFLNKEVEKRKRLFRASRSQKIRSAAMRGVGTQCKL